MRWVVLMSAMRWVALMQMMSAGEGLGMGDEVDPHPRLSLSEPYPGLCVSEELEMVFEMLQAVEEIHFGFWKEAEEEAREPELQQGSGVVQSRVHLLPQNLLFQRVLVGNRGNGNDV